MSSPLRSALLLTGLLHAGALAAQQRGAPFLRWEPSSDSSQVRQADGRFERQPGAHRDYRYEGLAFGGLVLGALGVWMGSELSGACPLEPGASCGTNQTEQAITLGLVGAAVGGGFGYLVGRLSPKVPRRPDWTEARPDQVSVPDSVRKRTGYQHWRGGAIGLAVGGVVGALTAVLSGAGPCDDCTRPLSNSGVALRLGLLGAGGGGVLGFLAGLATPRYASVPSGPP